VLAESSAFGDTGPWSGRMGYGPLVRAATGVTRLWTSDGGADDDGDDGGDASARHRFYDATTIFPDHVVGRITAIGALAALVRRRRSGIGARIHVSQAEAVINQLDTRYVMLAAETHHGAVREDHPWHLLLACAGDDEWCVVSLTSDDDRHAAAEVVGAGIGKDAADLPSALAAWAGTRTPADAAAALQAAGVAAGPMNRADDLLDDPQLLSRHVLAEMAHPGFAVTLPTEAGPAPYRNIPPAPQRPAPLPGADTRAICRDLLAMDDDDIERLLATGVLFATDNA
jgi:crotonobetainyl-CoA:carnitine CoA-transferase CaiB-like acyl-CoA transferase